MTNRMTLAPVLTKQFLDILDAVTDEFRLKIYRNGLTVKVVDPANVAMLNIDLPSSLFVNYEYDWTDEEIKVGIDIQKVKDFLTGASHEEDVMMGNELTEPVDFSFILAPDKYQVNLNSKDRYQLVLKQDIYSRTILCYRECDVRKEPKIPQLPFDYKLLFDTLELRRIIRKAEKVGDYIQFGVKREEPGTVVFSASTEDGDEMPWIASREHYPWEALSDSREVSSLFSIDYLQEIIKAIPAEQTWLYLGNDIPCKLEFILHSAGKVEYLQAPRVESE